MALGGGMTYARESSVKSWRLQCLMIGATTAPKFIFLLIVVINGLELAGVNTVTVNVRVHP